MVTFRPTTPRQHSITMEPDDTLSTRESVLSPVDLLPDRLQNALLPHERADEEPCPAGRLDETNDS